MNNFIFCFICCSIWESLINFLLISLLAQPSVQADGKPRCCVFSFSPNIQPSRVVRAQLWIHLRPAREATTVFLQISRLRSLTEGARHVRIRSLKIDVSAGISSWQSIDVKQVLQVWLRQPETNWGIEINALDAEGNDLAVTSTEEGEEGLVSALQHLFYYPLQPLTYQCTSEYRNMCR